MEVESLINDKTTLTDAVNFVAEKYHVDESAIRKHRLKYLKALKESEQISRDEQY